MKKRVLLLLLLIVINELNNHIKTNQPFSPPPPLVKFEIENFAAS